MLGLIQKYQKVIFALVAVLISLSFLFFGVLPKGGSAAPDKVAYQTSRKEKVKQSKFEGVKALLMTHNGEYTVFGPALGPHFFSESFFVSDLLKPGHLNLVFAKYLDELKAGQEEKYAKEKQFEPYIHPNASFLSAKSIWSIHAPQLEETIESYKKLENPMARFEKKQELFLEEYKFSPFSLWQVLSENERQFDWVPNDPNLNPERLNLFGYRTLEDWFGDDLVRKICGFIFEVNSIAKQRGYRLTDQEVEQNLMKQNQINYMKVQALGVKDFESSEAYFEAKLKRLGLNKVQMVSFWKELLIFRRFFQETGNAALLDSFSLSQFEQYAGKRVKAEQYALPEDLKCETFKEVMELELYLEALGKPLNQLNLEFKLKEMNEVAKTHPQFIETPFEIQYKEIDLQTAALGIRVQDIWNWKLNPDNYKRLTKEFPQLKGGVDHDSSQLQEQLEHLDSLSALKVDQFVRSVILKENEDWLEKALSMVDSKSQEHTIRPNGLGLPFKNLELAENKDEFLSQFEVKGIESEYAVSKEPFSFDGQHYYQILSLNQVGPQKWVDLPSLKKERVLERLLQKKIEESEGKTFKSRKGLTTSQLKAAHKIFEPLKNEILKDYLITYKDTRHHLEDDFYCDFRFHHAMKRALDYAKENHKSEKPYILANLWTIEKKPQTFTRYLSENHELNELIGLKEGQWTPVEHLNHELKFFHVVEKPKNHSSHLMQKKMKRSIRIELKQAMAKEILDQVDD